MSSTEFFTMVEHLNPGGVMVVNMKCPGVRSTRRWIPSPACSAIDGRRAEHHEFGLRKASRRSTCVRPPTSAPGEDLEWYMEEVASRFRKVNEPDSASTILTDDKAPVEVLGMHAIDQIIADEAGPYRQKDEGFGLARRAEVRHTDRECPGVW